MNMKLLTTSVVLFFSFIYCTYAQSLKQVLILNEGSFDFVNNKIIVPVSVGSYDPTSKQYTTLFDIPNARFASDIKLDGSTFWVAADQYLNQYQLSDNKLIRSKIVEGVRKVEFYQDYVIVTKGEYNKTLDSYVQILNKSDLSIAYSIPSSIQPFTTENISIHNDKAYIAVNNGFVFGEEVGKLLVIDLKTLSLESTIELGIDGKNPENLMVANNTLYSLNNKNYTGSSISKITIDQTQNVTTTNLPGVSSLCGTSALVDQAIIYQESGKTVVGSYSLTDDQTKTLKDFGKSFYGLTYDPKSGYLYGGETDFFSYGQVFIYDRQYELVNQFSTSISPGYFVFDYSLSSGTYSGDKTTFNVYPNPAGDMIQLNFIPVDSKIILTDVLGHKIILPATSQQINIKHIHSGLYQMQAKTDSGLVLKTLVKI